MPAEGFEGLVATDGSLLGAAGKWGACGWSEVQLDYGEELVPLHGMCGSMEAEYEVQRTVKTAELTPSCASSGKCVVPSRSMWTTREELMGYEKGEKECIKPRAGDADLWIKNWEELHELTERGILEHVMAYRTKKEKEQMTHFARFIAEGDEKADELAKSRSNDDRSESCDCEAGEGGSSCSLAVCS